MTEWNPEAYSQVSKLQQWLAEKSLASLTLRGDERVLDLGCGHGKISAAIAARLPHGSVLGADASHDMVAFAGRTFPPSQHPNLAFQVADAAHLGFDGEFDLVVSFNCLHWVRDQAAALRGIAAALAPEGRTHLRLVARGSRTSLEAAIEDTRRASQCGLDSSGCRGPAADRGTLPVRAQTRKKADARKLLSTPSRPRPVPASPPVASRPHPSI